MIQTYYLIQKQIERLNGGIKEKTFIQKIYSSASTICLCARTPGKTIYIYFGRGKGVEGLWVDDKNIPSELRKIDRFLEYLRKYLSSCQLLGLELDERDRIIKLNYQKWGRENYLYLFYKGRELYFAHYFYNEKLESMDFMCSWDSKNRLHQGYETFDYIGRKKLNQIKKTTATNIEVKELLKKELSSGLLLTEKKNRRFLSTKRKKIRADLERVENRAELIEIIQKNEDLSKLPERMTLTYHRLKFKTTEHFHRQDEIYTKVKKLKRAEKILQERLIDTEDKLCNLEDTKNYKSRLQVVSPVWKEKKTNTVERKLETGIRIYMVGGVKFAIGETAQGNDYLRKEWGSKEDWWLHLDSDVSPHLVVKLEQEHLTPELLSILGSAILDKSKKESSEINLIYTQLKNLKGVKGSPGLVTYKKEKRIRVSYEKEWNNENI